MLASGWGAFRLREAADRRDALRRIGCGRAGPRRGAAAGDRLTVHRRPPRRPRSRSSPRPAPRRRPGRRAAARRRDRGRPRAGPGQPDRRAHRLQRRVRDAGRDRARDPARRPADRRSPGRRHPRRHRRDGRVRPRRDRAAERGPGSTTSPGTAWALAEAGHRRCAGSAACSRATCRRAPGCRRRRRSRWRRRWRCSGRRTAPGRPMPRATLGRRAENGYVGVQSGVMDQFASAAGVADHAILLDCRSLECRPVPLPLRDVRARRLPQRLVAQARDVGVQRAPGASATGPSAQIAATRPGVRSLRDVDARDCSRPPRHGWTRSPPAARRHVVEENAPRPRDRARRSRRATWTRSGGCSPRATPRCATCTRSARPELDALVEIATAVDGVVGARLTGAGFGGSTINLVRAEAVDALRAAVERDYPARTGLHADACSRSTRWRGRASWTEREKGRCGMRAVSCRRAR